MIVVEEPLQSVAYLHDGTLEGLLSSVFLAYARHEQPDDIVAEDAYQPRLGQSSINVETDFEHAERVKAGVVKAAGYKAFRVLARASTCDDPNVGVTVLAFVRYCIDYQRERGCKPSLDDLSNPTLSAIMDLSMQVQHESELIRQFARFSLLENGIWYSCINPKASVIPFVMNHFAARLNSLPFIIYDEVHAIAGIHDGRSWMLVRENVVDVPSSTDHDRLMQEAWKVFYDSLSVEARYNPELRRSFLPNRLWRNLTEMMPRRQL